MEEVPEPGEEQNELDKVEEWQTEQYVQRIQRNKKELYVTCGEKCWRISRDRKVEVPELCSCQEEAVTRLLLRARWL